MHILEECMAELRYLGSLRGRRLSKYLAKASPRVIECLYQIALNLVFAHKNGLNLRKHHVSQLKKKKKKLLRLVQTKEENKRRHLIKQGGLAIPLLSVLAGVIATLAATL